MEELTFNDYAELAMKGDLSPLDKVRYNGPLLEEIVLQPSLLITSETHFNAFGMGFIWFLLHGEIAVEGFRRLLEQWHPVMYGIGAALEAAGRLSSEAEDLLMDIELQLPVKFSADSLRESELPLWMLLNFMRFVSHDLKQVEKGRFMFLRNPYGYHQELALYFSGIRQSLQVGEIIEMTHLTEALRDDRRVEVWALLYLLREEHEIDILSIAWKRLWNIRGNYRQYNFLSEAIYKKQFRELDPSLSWTTMRYCDKWMELTERNRFSMDSLNGLTGSIPQMGGQLFRGIIRRFGLLQANPSNLALKEDTRQAVERYLQSQEASSLGVLTLYVVGLIDHAK